MTREEASSLVQFIKDHDTRFEATAMDQDGESYVLLTEPVEGKRLDPVYAVEEYRQRHIDAADPGPTIREAWERWRAASREDGGGGD